MTTTRLSAAPSGLTDALTEITSALGAGSPTVEVSTAELIDVVSALEQHKRAAAAAQAQATAALSAVVNAADAERGTRRPTTAAPSPP